MFLSQNSHNSYSTIIDAQNAPPDGAIDAVIAWGRANEQYPELTFDLLGQLFKRQRASRQAELETAQAKLNHDFERAMKEIEAMPTPKLPFTPKKTLPTTSSKAKVQPKTLPILKTQSTNTVYQYRNYTFLGGFLGNYNEQMERLLRENEANKKNKLEAEKRVEEEYEKARVYAEHGGGSQAQPNLPPPLGIPWRFLRKDADGYKLISTTKEPITQSEAKTRPVWTKAHDSELAGDELINQCHLHNNGKYYSEPRKLRSH